MSDLNTIKYPDFVRNAEIKWLAAAEDHQKNMVMRNSSIVREMSIPSNTGDTREFSEIELEQYAKFKGEGEEAKLAKTQQGYNKIGQLQRRAHSQKITWEMRNRGKYLEIQSAIKNLLPTVMNRLELDLQHRISFATENSYVDMDGRTVDTTTGDTLPLAHPAHTVRGSSDTFRNILANNPQFSRGSLEAMEKMRIENSINQFGQKVPVQDEIIWTTEDPNTKNSVREVLQSTASTEDNKNSGVMNTYSNKYTHIALPLVATDAQGNHDVSKAKYWGLAASGDNSQMFLGVHEEPHVMEGSNNSNTPSTDDWEFHVRGDWMIVTPGARWFAMSKGDGSA